MRQVTIHRVDGQFHVAKVREGDQTENFQKGAQIKTGVLFDDIVALYAREGYTANSDPRDQSGPQTILFFEPGSGVLARLKGERGSGVLPVDQVPQTITRL